MSPICVVPDCHPPLSALQFSMLGTGERGPVKTFPMKWYNKDRSQNISYLYVWLPLYFISIVLTTEELLQRHGEKYVGCHCWPRSESARRLAVILKQWLWRVNVFVQPTFFFSGFSVCEGLQLYVRFLQLSVGERNLLLLLVLLSRFYMTGSVHDRKWGRHATKGTENVFFSKVGEG